MTPQECESFARSEMKKWNIGHWGFCFNNKKTSLGLCYYRQQRIEVSRHHLNSTDAEVKNTVLHEIAHALCFIHNQERGHGYNWKRWCVKVGAKPTRCGSSSGMTYKYSYYCRNCNKIVHRSHRQVRANYICSKCKSGLETHLTEKLDESIQLSSKLSEIEFLIGKIGKTDIRLELKRNLMNLLVLF